MIVDDNNHAPSAADSRAVEIAKERELRALFAARHRLRLVSDPIALRCGLEYDGQIIRTARVHLLTADELALIGKAFAPASYDDAFFALQIAALGSFSDGLIDVIDNLYKPDERLLLRALIRLNRIMPNLSAATMTRLDEGYNLCQTEAAREKLRARYRQLITRKCLFG